MTIIADSLQAIHANINSEKCAANRQDIVQLLAVSKSQSAQKVREAYLAGQTAFGENYVQEAIAKQALLEDCNIEWHFIGPIQSNKTQLIAQHFDWVHSVDRIKIAERLASARPARIELAKMIPPETCPLITSQAPTVSRADWMNIRVVRLAVEMIASCETTLRFRSDRSRLTAT